MQLLLLASVPAVCPGFSRNAAAAEEEGAGPAVSAKAYCVMDADSGEVVAAANERERLAPASITKILTALVVLEHTESLDVPAAFSESSLEDLAVLSSTLSPMPRPGEVMTVRDLLYGMIMRSGNECANLLAELTAGSCEAFAGMMNERAAQAGALDSHFSNPHGLDAPDHLTTALDMALITRDALADSRTAELLSAASYTIPATDCCGERVMESGHAMLNGSLPADGVFAGKPGYTPGAGWTLVTAAEEEGRRLIAVVLGCAEGCSYSDTGLLLRYGFEKLSGKTPSGGALVYSPVVSSYDASGFTVSWRVGPDAVSADFPVWIEYDPQDVMTRETAPVTGDSVSCRVLFSDHGGRVGVYTVQAYVYDGAGTAHINTLKVLAGLPALTPGFTDWDGGRFYVRENGSLALNWAELPEGAYHFDYLTGRMDTGWIESGGASFYLGTDGSVKTGWQDIDGSTYYFMAPGDLLRGDAVIDGLFRHIDAEGRLQNFDFSLEIARRILDTIQE